jgi:uncharacterized protein
MTQARSLPRVVYIHGDGVLYWSWGWVATLQKELQSAGFPTFFELLPDSIEGRAQYWMPFLRDHVCICESDVLLGWSCGAVAAMRCAEQHRVRGLVLVAPYFTNSLGLELVERAGWVNAPWDWPRVRANAGHIAMFHSDADPYISQAELTQLAGHLQADVNVIAGAGHFGEQDTFPELRELIMKVYG